MKSLIKFNLATDKASPLTIMRRHGDREIRRNMLWLLVGTLTFNSAIFYVIFHLDYVVEHFSYEGEHKIQLHDQVMLFGWVISFSIIIVLVASMRKTRELLSDIHNLAVALDKEKDLKNRRQKMEALGVMAAGVSHEINTCLQAVLGSCEMARNREENDEERKQYLKRAIDNSLHARRVVGNVLTFAGASEEQQRDSLEPLEFYEVVEEAVEYSRAYLPPSVKIIQDQEENGAGMLAMVNRVSLVQVISNLISNGAHAMSYNGVIKVHSCQLDLTAETCPPDVPPGNYLMVAVKDSGNGIAPETFEKIFDPFFTTKPVGEGTGLGLSIVHGLVKSMNGHIHVKTMVGIGTEFTVYLPVIKESKNEA